MYEIIPITHIFYFIVSNIAQQTTTHQYLGKKSHYIVASSVRTTIPSFVTVLFGVIITTMATCTANRITKANNQFGTELFKRVAKDDGNMLISPLSAHVVLSMAYQGADGETAANMAKVFHLPNPNEAANEYHKVIDQLNKVQSVTLNVANKIYVMQKFVIYPEFKSIIQTKYLSEADEIDFAENEKAANTINEWVENKTNKRIKELIKADMLDAMTRLVLVNAVYFKGSWAKKFDSALTSKKPFYLLNGEEISVDMMHLNSKFKYGEDDTLNCKIIELPYEGNEMSMVIFLPNERNGILQLQEKIASVDLTDVMKQLSQFTVNLELPKFKIESTIPLKDTLEQMGAGHMFTNAANFSKMTKEPLKVSNVIQKTFIEVNEEGAEAAAATDVVFSRRNLDIGMWFVADKPFVFFLIYKNKYLIFLGKYSPEIIELLG